jgi:hypothetical protein
MGRSHYLSDQKKPNIIMLHTLLIALAVIASIGAIVALCIFVTRRQTRHRRHQLQDNYRTILVQHNVTPDFSQTFEHRIFAFDTTRAMFAFAQSSEEHPSGVIELSEVEECTLWKDGVQINKNGGTKASSVEEYVNALGLSFRQKSGVVTNIPVYTEVLDGIE